MAEIDKFIRMARQIDASDVHIAVGSPPMVRLNGMLRKVKHPPFTPDDTRRMFYEILAEPARKELEENWELDVSYSLEDGALPGQHLRPEPRSGRDVPAHPEHGEKPGRARFPAVVKKLLEYRQGMILVTGQAGCGKTTTLAAMVRHLNERRYDHIICLEDPIEILHPMIHCQITQREVGRDTLSFGRALRACLREDPDIIVVGEMRDLDTISNAITAAETGHLVLATLHTTNAARTIGRILDVFPPSQQGQIRTMVADALRGVISQQLVPTADGKGRVVCIEALVVTPAISNLIKDDRTFQIPSLMQTGVKQGMQLMDDGLYRLLQQGVISPETALERAYDRSKFTDLTKAREQQVNWDELMALPDDKSKRRMLVDVGVIVLDRKTQEAKYVKKDRVPFLFYQTRHGKLPEEAIYAELVRLFPEVGVEPEEEG